MPPTIIKEIQQFSTIVRQQDIKNLQIVNRTNANWQIKPVIDGEQWDGPKIIDIPPQQIGIYELTYKPLTMTLDGAKHKVRCFLIMCQVLDDSLHKELNLAKALLKIREYGELFYASMRRLFRSAYTYQISWMALDEGRAISRID